MYSQLAKWHAVYGDKIEMLLYPSDEFGGQELPSDQIAPFVQSKGLPTSGGGCTLMQKSKVNGPAADPVWKLAKKSFPGDVTWNFAGIILFDAKGEPSGRFAAQELPAVGEALKRLVEEAKQEL